jgi:hypothetical protein
MHTQTTTYVGDDTDRRLFVTRILVERLVDELDQLERLAWADQDLDRGELRRLAYGSCRIATAMLDELAPSSI